MEGYSDDLDRLTVNKFDDGVGRTRTRFGKTENSVAGGLPEHLLEVCVRQAVQAALFIEQNFTGR